MAPTEVDWEAVIGLEIHVQLSTRSKIFSGAPVASSDAPNTHLDEVTLGMPGVLPVLNREVVDKALRIGLALGCEVHARSRFARKHYFYPDLPKGYQITQYSEPLCTGGRVWARVGDGERPIGLTRIQLEEDAGKTVHEPALNRSRVDYDRAGIPLVEIVSEPDMRSPEEAVAFMRALHQVVVAVGSCDGNLEAGNFRCDANVSVRPRRSARLGTKVEIKNVNSFRFVSRALEHEIRRQTALLGGGGRPIHETRLWDAAAGVTRPMRSKEEVHDYRYFPDPDLMVLEVDADWVERVRSELPELPRARRRRFVRQYGLSDYDAGVLTRSTPRADYFEEVVRGGGDPKRAANWIQGDLLAALHKGGLDLDRSPVGAPALVELLTAIDTGSLSGSMAKQCLLAMVESGIRPSDWIARHGGRMSDPGAIDEVVRRVLGEHLEQVEAFLGGKDKLLGFFVGQVMRATGGRADPEVVSESVGRHLEEMRS